MFRADGKRKVWLNTKTGEIVRFRSKLTAIHYFKVDGKKFGYEVSRKDIVQM